MIKQAMELALEALTLILPLAKGYAYANPVGSNSAYCSQSESAIAALKEAIKQHDNGKGEQG